MIDAGGGLNKVNFITGSPGSYKISNTEEQNLDFNIQDGYTPASSEKDEDPGKKLRDFKRTNNDQNVQSLKSESLKGSKGVLSLLNSFRTGAVICFSAALLGAFTPIVSSAQEPQKLQEPNKIEMTVAKADTAAAKDTLILSGKEIVSIRNGGALADYAKSWVGKKFKAGQTKRCADFVSTCIEKSNVTPAKFRHQISAYQLQMYGSPVKKQDLRPGDLVFFKNTYAKRDFTHVGIYIGEGQFIHRPTFNSPVETERLDTGYFSSHFSCGRRLDFNGKEYMDSLNSLYTANIPNPAIPQIILSSR